MGRLRWAGFSEARAEEDRFQAGHKLPNLAWHSLVVARGEGPRADSEGNQEGLGADGQVAAGVLAGQRTPGPAVRAVAVPKA